MTALPRRGERTWINTTNAVFAPPSREPGFIALLSTPRAVRAYRLTGPEQRNATRLVAPAIYLRSFTSMDAAHRVYHRQHLDEVRARTKEALL